MMLLATFLPIIIVIGLIVIFSMKQSRTKRKFPISGAKTRSLLIGYSVFLLVVLVFSFFIPVESTSNNYIISQEELDKKHQDFYDAAHQGSLDTFDSAHVAEKWTFSVEDDALYLETRNTDYLGVSVFAQRKEESDGEVEIAYYTTRPMVEGFDITHLINPTVIKQEGNTLFLQQGEDVNVHVTKFAKDFTITQFVGKDTGLMNHEYTSVQVGPSILFLRIPNDLKLVDRSDLYIQFVGSGN
ncbi:hypothetical protein N0O92_15335 [Alkalihalobacillus sp. MEB130]|uniref:hypothetical protein n=1 Tax=Alkalihalobacillus sp. MEB130 TaxID=2976704 RepID=UPI0028DEA8F0|nr:hypothetical protein [Alkalihalobacillus sp. MEB130]MDT8861590.1 hypothetical protein [Alkalihalobacillus sp. MEB130]